MDNRHEQFLNLYLIHRHKEQIHWYEDRYAELERARRQAIYAAAILMFLTTLVSILATFAATKNPPLPAWVWATLRVFFPALSTALTAYNSLFAFDRQAKFYKDACGGLHRAEADAYRLQKAVEKAESQKMIEDYVNKVEGIFRNELGQWGQLISEIKPIEPLISESKKE